ncbi:glutamine-hydrolyzing carbamoyl-phosphate synthase small subunit [Candidatus Poriferisocius sp.]|uniref:glutamine-hydrolyzing carbamoyl-phosphate synthase small subunit n=1 Tax=Candidatus Poriferisocius sp. TaxID=3101276 RepID=UPI003B58E452
MIRPGVLVLSDGEVFEGEAIGAAPANGITSGEVVFNTVLTGYQEVITDPSYAGQIITFTYPHIGNYGVTPLDHESRRPFCRGVIVREMARRRSSWRATDDLDAYLAEQGIAGLAGVDTRRLTSHIRDAGAMPGAFGTAAESDLRAAARAEPGTDGVDLVATVTRTEPELFPTTRDDGRAPHRVVALDFGLKATIVRHLQTIATVEVVPAATAAADVLARNPDGVFLSNGPGDPEAVVGAVETISGLLGKVPVFGICLGHQLLAATLGGETYKLPFGHHGGNHPVRNLATGAVEITSQNHNFCVADTSVPGADITHINLNDHTVEGLRCRDLAAFSVQYHPEAGPGPHDSRYLFAEFDELMTRTARG